MHEKYLSKYTDVLITINQEEISEVVESRLQEILNLSKKEINHLTKKEISYIIIYLLF